MSASVAPVVAKHRSRRPLGRLAMTFFARERAEPSASTAASQASMVRNALRASAAPGARPGVDAQITWLACVPFASSRRARIDQLRQLAWMSPAGFWLPRRSMIGTRSRLSPSLIRPPR